MTRAAQWLYGWLLLLPAAALLALFTHYPAVATLVAQLPVDAQGQPARGVRVGLDNYAQLADDPIFWQALVEQSLVRARHDSGCRSRSRC